MDKNEQSVIATPTSERIISLDVLRGFAVLGILVMNIQSYAMISAAYINPTAYGDFNGLNRWVWMFSHIFFDQKFMTLFALLFGAGMILFTDRLAAKGIPSLNLHYRRIFWIFIIGLVHAYLFWYGDILVTYALCALVMVLLRKLKPNIQLILGLILIAIPSIIYLIWGVFWDYIPPEAQEQIRIGWQSSPSHMEKELAVYRSNWLEQMRLRIPEAMNFQTFIFLIQTGWRSAGVMLIGMAFYRWGIITAAKSMRFYILLFLTGMIIGLSFIIGGMIKNMSAGWSVEYSMFLGWQYNYWGSLFLSAAFLSVLMIICKRTSTWISRLLAPVGRMALTNYLLQTIIATTIFYGHGLGLFGNVSRINQFLIVIVIWVVEVVLSSLWLARYRFGPAEWLWRSLTYWKRQPMRL